MANRRHVSAINHKTRDQDQQHRRREGRVCQERRYLLWLLRDTADVELKVEMEAIGHIETFLAYFRLAVIKKDRPSQDP